MARKAKTIHPRAVPVPAAERDVPQAPEMPFAQGAGDELDASLRHRLISDAAYALYCKRGYVDGYDLEDWLEAEAQVDHTLLGPSVRDTEAAERL